VWQTIHSSELVPGDIVHLKVGDIVPADVEILIGNASVNEAVLTGESIDVDKKSGDLVSTGSTITHGEIIGRVTATGKDSSYGKTVELVRTAEAPGRLQVLLFNIIRYLAHFDLVLIIILTVTALIRGTPILELLPFLAILVIATIPISMPSAFTVANALEAQRLANEGVLVTGLTGIQETASMDVLLIDKTGTLTNNRPEIAEILSFGDINESDLLKLAFAASDETSNDSINTAIERAFEERKLDTLKRLSFTPFDPTSKVSRARVLRDGKEIEVVLGSPLIIKEIAIVHDNFEETLDLLGSKGYRVIAVAFGDEGKFICNGLVALADSLREDAAESISKIKEFGIRVIMLTGDTISTTKAIAKKVGIGERIGTLSDALSNLSTLMVLQMFTIKINMLFARLCRRWGR
jgi:H+-transporting ATPase